MSLTVCVCYKFIYCTSCMCTVSSCPSWVHTHCSASCCCCRLQSGMMKTLISGISGILLTFHSHILLQQVKVGETDTYTCNNITNTYFRYWSCWICGSGGWGTSILLLNPPHDGCRSWDPWDMLPLEVLLMLCPSPQERNVSSGASFCSNLFSTPSRRQEHCRLWLRLVFSNCSYNCQLLHEELLSQLIVIACDVWPPSPCVTQDNHHPMVLLRGSSMWHPHINLQVPRTVYDKAASIFCWFRLYALPEGAVAPK